MQATAARQRKARRGRPGDPKVAVAYLRVSTDEQQAGMQAQRDAIAAWAAREGVQVVAWCQDDGVSGATAVEDREGFMAALEALAQHRAGLLVLAKWDRLARDVMQSVVAQRLAEERGAKAWSADGAANGDSPSDALMRQILAAFAEYERALIRARTRAALRAKKARGVAYTREAPYGWSSGGAGTALVPVPAEQDTLARMRALREAGASLRAVVAALNGEGRVQRNGKPWSLTTLATVLRRSEGGAA